MRRDLDRRHPSRLDGQLTQIMLDVIGQGLRICRTARSAAPDVIVKLGNLVGNAVGHVRAGGNAGVGTEDDPAGERDGDDGRARGEFAGSEVPGFGRFAVVGTAHGGGSVGMVMVREGAHLEGIQQARAVVSRGGTAPKVVESLGWDFDPDFRQKGKFRHLSL